MTMIVAYAGGGGHQFFVYPKGGHHFFSFDKGGRGHVFLWGVLLVATAPPPPVEIMNGHAGRGAHVFVSKISDGLASPICRGHKVKDRRPLRFFFPDFSLFFLIILAIFQVCHGGWGLCPLDPQWLCHCPKLGSVHKHGLVQDLLLRGAEKEFVSK